MSFGFSITDIVQAAHIAKQIKEIWFTRLNRADIHYFQFGRDVGGLEGLLDKFGQAFDEYARVREIQLSVSDYHSWELKTLKEKQEQAELVGGFLETVQQCQELLEENGKYLTKKSNAWDNAKWHVFGGKERADKLRGTIQFHCTKISVFMQTLSVSVQAATANALRDIRIQIERLPLLVLREILAGLSGGPRKECLHPVMPALYDQYIVALELDKPDAYADPTRFPLKEGLDALATALEQSTIKFKGNGLGIWHPTVQQLNNLIKARWIFDRMVESTHLREAGPDSLWRWCLESIQEQIKMEYAKYEREIVAEEANIASLDFESFRIWMPPQETSTISITEADESQLEEKILGVSLDDQGQHQKELIVFRRPRNELRLVTVTSRVNGGGSGYTPHEDNKVVNMHQVQVIPKYALPGRPRVPYNKIIELCFPGASSGHTYQFKMDEDLLKFQQALLGYKVVLDNSNCRWAFHRSNSWGRTEKAQGVGRIQIWQAKSLATPKKEFSSRSLPSASPRQSRTDSIHSNSTMASTVRPRPRIPEPAPGAGNAVALQRPALPILVIFTEVNVKPTFLVLKLDPSIEIHLPSCDCGSHKEKKQEECLRTVLECNPPKREKFAITQLSADHGADLSSWNIALFGYPRHPSLDDVEKLKGVRWLSLDGQTPQERAELQSSLRIIGKIRDRQQNDYDTQEGMISRRADRPVQRQARELPVRTSRAFSPLSSPSLVSESSKFGYV
ncbi:hypothetical protein K458DRAFT_411959 [Lentithecium fluviatile CBS 122367]|uniref:Uncharacterized protein n=1 Tax=Lentithecium fluviatile CBS 122367 TaxID=1168545 RepID=A0A6G1JJG6_9PLEO|nr:hypothetical protein K458DRAFT_411959 [Lentithecium fluviatile CBS 122367]